MKAINADVIAISLFAVLALVFTAASYASSCKNLEQDACASASACTWVDGYKRSDGREVKSYCRTSPKKHNMESSLQAKPAKG